LASFAAKGRKGRAERASARRQEKYQKGATRRLLTALSPGKRLQEKKKGEEKGTALVLSEFPTRGKKGGCFEEHPAPKGQDQKPSLGGGREKKKKRTAILSSPHAPPQKDSKKRYSLA